MEQHTVVMQAIRSPLQPRELREVQLLLLQIIRHPKGMTRVVITSRVHGDSNKVMVTMEPRVTKRHTRSKVYMHSCFSCILYIVFNITMYKRILCFIFRICHLGARIAWGITLVLVNHWENFQCRWKLHSVSVAVVVEASTEWRCILWKGDGGVHSW